ncbi:MAG: prolipoprotein diacylglyceryl transferase, partial [Oscillospiraceae bacterium]|nr:prolipoprotein diacylglyceryl transferase [Oscillospiraceae bacterium]
LYIWEGGLAIYGGVIGGVIGLAVYSKLKKMPFWTVLDVASLGVIVGQICGRWGNFMNREAHGGETASFLRMGLTAADGTVRYYHPTFLYESLWNLIGLLLMHFISKKRKFDGQVACFYFFWYGLGRAWIEGMRTDSLYLFGTGIRVSQLLAILCVIAAGGMLAYMLFVRKADGSGLYAARAAEAEPAAEEAAENSQ